MQRKLAAGTVILLAAIVLIAAVILVSRKGYSDISLSQECMPCSTGSEATCHAGCLTEEGIRDRLKSVRSLQAQLASLKKLTKLEQTTSRANSEGKSSSVGDEEKRISVDNAQLLRLSNDKEGGLSGQLNDVQKYLLRAEVDEVQLRRQARLQAGQKKTIMSAFKSLRSFKYRHF